jgi:hypothetical protein
MPSDQESGLGLLHNLSLGQQYGTVTWPATPTVCGPHMGHHLILTHSETKRILGPGTLLQVQYWYTLSAAFNSLLTLALEQQDFDQP